MMCCRPGPGSRGSASRLRRSRISLGRVSWALAGQCGEHVGIPYGPTDSLRCSERVKEPLENRGPWRDRKACTAVETAGRQVFAPGHFFACRAFIFGFLPSLKNPTEHPTSQDLQGGAESSFPQSMHRWNCSTAHAGLCSAAGTCPLSRLRAGPRYPQTRAS